MKKNYEAPTVEKIVFNYRDQVVASSYPQGTEPDTNRNGKCDPAEFNYTVSTGCQAQ